MNELFQIALIVIPAGGIFYTAYFFMNKQLDREKQHMMIELRKERQKYFLPNRVEAYQRAVLFLERIHPNSLVMRLHQPGMPAKGFQADLLKAIREEYDHNVAQQLFVSPKGWDMVKNSKEETIKVINIAGNLMGPTSTSTDLSAKIFELMHEIGKLPSEIAVDLLKKELQELF